MLTTKEIQQVQKSIVKDLSVSGERLPFVFEALADPTRLKIFQLLMNNRDLCVTDLANICKISVPAVSHQMRIMEVVGLVTKERMGKMICYQLKSNDSLVKKVMSIIQ